MTSIGWNCEDWKAKDFLRSDFDLFLVKFCWSKAWGPFENFVTLSHFLVWIRSLWISVIIYKRTLLKFKWCEKYSKVCQPFVLTFSSNPQKHFLVFNFVGGVHALFMYHFSVHISDSFRVSHICFSFEISMCMMLVSLFSFLFSHTSWHAFRIFGVSGIYEEDSKIEWKDMLRYDAEYSTWICKTFVCSIFLFCLLAALRLSFLCVSLSRTYKTQSLFLVASFLIYCSFIWFHVHIFHVWTDRMYAYIDSNHFARRDKIPIEWFL